MKSYRQERVVSKNHGESNLKQTIVYHLDGKETPDLRPKICEKNAMYKATLSDPQLIEYKKNKLTQFTVEKH